MTARPGGQGSASALGGANLHAPGPTLSVMKGDLNIAGDPDGDALLNSDPLALLIGMLLDQNMQ